MIKEFNNYVIMTSEKYLMYSHWWSLVYTFRHNRLVSVFKTTCRASNKGWLN